MMGTVLTVGGRAIGWLVALTRGGYGQGGRAGLDEMPWARLPAALPAVSRSASRFLTRWDPLENASSPMNPGNSGFSAETQSVPEADALSS